MPDKIISGLSAAALFLIPLVSPAECFAAEEPGFTYTIINNEATVTGFTGEPVILEIPDTVEGCAVTEIRDNAFYECGSLKQISLPAGLKKMGHHCFYACFSLESVVLPEALEELGMGCFCGCASLSAVTLPDGLTELPESCFRACTSLTDIVIPQNIADIGDFCFSGDVALSYVSMSGSTASLGDCAFYMCSAMDSLYIPPSVTDIGLCAVGYVPTPEGAVAKEGFTVLGKKKSAADSYSAENKLGFVSVSDPVQAFAIQSIGSRRLSAGVPAVLLGGGILLLIVALTGMVRRRRQLRKK